MATALALNGTSTGLAATEGVCSCSIRMVIRRIHHHEVADDEGQIVI
jgi:hypothetical protein